MNQTAVDINMTVFEDDDYCTQSKIFVGLVGPILSFLIIILYWGIIYYEKFGHDPLKRDLSNMLFSSLCKSVSIINAFLIAVGTIRIMFGPILTSIAFFCYFIQLNFTNYMNFVCYEIVIYTFLTLCTKANIVNINDTIWHSVLNRTNVMFAVLISTVFILTTTDAPIIIHFLSGRLIMFDKLNVQLPVDTL